MERTQNKHWVTCLRLLVYIRYVNMRTHVEKDLCTYCTFRQIAVICPRSLICVISQSNTTTTTDGFVNVAYNIGSLAKPLFVFCRNMRVQQTLRLPGAQTNLARRTAH